jgi:hypothetical protein
MDFTWSVGKTGTQHALANHITAFFMTNTRRTLPIYPVALAEAQAEAGLACLHVNQNKPALRTALALPPAATQSAEASGIHQG